MRRPRFAARGGSQLSALIEGIPDGTERPITAILADSEKRRFLWTVVRRCRNHGWCAWRHIR